MVELYLGAAYHSNLPWSHVLTEAFDAVSISPLLTRPKLADSTKKRAGKIRTPLQHSKGNCSLTTN